MKWRTKTSPLIGQRRTVKVFLLLPRSLPLPRKNGPKHWETRWFCFAQVVQKYHEAFSMFGGKYGFWKDEEWATS